MLTAAGVHVALNITLAEGPEFDSAECQAIFLLVLTKYTLVAQQQLCTHRANAS